jgi:hypothetical protein
LAQGDLRPPDVFPASVESWEGEAPAEPESVLQPLQDRDILRIGAIFIQFNPYRDSGVPVMMFNVILENAEDGWVEEFPELL